MNLTIFPFNFYFKITPLCPWYQSKKKNNSTPVITIVGVPFTAMHINRKWAFYSFNIPWRYQICIAKCIYSYRDDLPQNLFKITAQEYKKSTVLLTCVDQKRRCFKGLPKMMAGNGIYSPPMKIISNTILFVYSLRGALIKIARVCHMRWRNYFDGTNPISSLQRRRSKGFVTLFCPTLVEQERVTRTSAWRGYPISWKGQKVSSCVLLARLSQTFHI